MLDNRRELTTEDLNALCRVCLQQPESEELLDPQLVYDEDEQLTYGDCFTLCTDIDLMAEQHLGLPHTLCKSCGLELQIAYDFRKKVEISKRFFSTLSPSAVSAMVGRVEGVSHKQLEQQGESASEREYEHVNIECERIKRESLTEDLLDSVECLESAVIDQVAEGLEEFLDYDQEDEHLEEDDEEAITVVECVSDDKTYYVMEEQTHEEDAPHETEDGTISWQTAVVTVANEEHLPLGNAAHATAHDCGDVEEVEVELEPVDEEEVAVYEHECDMEDNNQQQAHTPSQPASPTTTTTTSKDWPLPADEAADSGAEGGATSDTAADAEAAATPATANRKRYTGKFSCTYCHKVFPNHSRMVVHRRSHEPDRPKFPCGHCERVYATKQAMEVHERSVHTKTSVYDCSICGKVYAIKKGLEVHMRYHTGTFPYACELCDRKFAQMSHLTTHRNVKHNSARFACEHPNCGKFFTSSASLRNHEFSHGAMPFECEFCQRGYPAKSKLKVHIRRKHGQEMSLDQLEQMRKFHVMRSKLHLVKVLECED